MRAIIVEDEQPARQLIQNYLKDIQDLEVIGEYPDGFSGAVAINRDKPDLVFLDIQLPRIDGFELLELLEYNPQIIFTTANDEHAIAAFERNATDYLLKPFSKDRFLKALDKAREKHELYKGNVKSIPNIIESIAKGLPLNRIVIKDSKGIHVISVDEISHFEAQDDYVMIYTANARYIKKLTLKQLESRLNSNQFVRVHRSCILNTNEIKRIEPYEKDSYMAILEGNVRVKISGSGYKNLRKKLEF
jgi:two-component system LytT family response regulator